MSKLKVKQRVVITLGDPAGIGAEVVAKALLKTSVASVADYILIGNQNLFEKVWPKNKLLPSFIHIESNSRRKISLGRPNAQTGYDALLYLKKAISLIQNDYADSMVTAPLSKEYVSRHVKTFRGHTEYLQKAFKVKNIGMFFVTNKLKVMIATRHIALRKVSTQLKQVDVVSSAQLIHQTLYNLYKIRNPKIGVCGLNPHAGENGVIGDEEIKTIIPAMNKLKRAGMRVFGPLSADTLFVPHNVEKYDAILAMYHDQGLIPIKAQYFDELVNLTVGLPFIRTSPAHGTGFDIAGKNRAHPGSMIASIKLAARC